MGASMTPSVAWSQSNAPPLDLDGTENESMPAGIKKQSIKPGTIKMSTSPVLKI